MKFIKKHKVDLIIITIFFTCSIICYLLIHILYMKKGKMVEVFVDGKCVASYSLEKDGEYKVGDDTKYNIIKISNASVTICEASCKNHICVNHKPISNVGESIICLPNHMVVQITGEKSIHSDEIDDVVK